MIKPAIVTPTEQPIKVGFYDFCELGFTAVAKVFSHYVEFEIYEQVGDPLDFPDNPTWQLADADCSPEPTDALRTAQKWLVGSVKWDGCSNWMFTECQDNMYLHACDEDQLLSWGELLKGCWILAGSLMQSFDPEVPVPTARMTPTEADYSALYGEMKE